MYKPARQFSPSPGPQGGDRRGTNHHRRKKFFIPAVLNCPALFLRGRTVGALFHTVWEFHPFEYEMIVSKVDMIQGWHPERDTGLGGNGYTAPNPRFLNPLPSRLFASYFLSRSVPMNSSVEYELVEHN